MTLRFLPESSSRDLAFAAGELDAEAGLQDKNWLQRTKAQDGVAVDVFSPAEEAELYLNVSRPPLNNLKVRQALASAIDQSQFAAFQGKDFTQAATSVVPSNNLGFTADNGMLRYDPVEAKALLAEAGYPKGFAIPMVNSQLTGLANLGQLVQAQLGEVGVRVEIQPVEHAAYHKMIRADASPLVIYSAARFPVADVYLTQFFYGPSQIGGPAQVTNFSHCDVADAEIAAAKSETDAARQTAEWVSAQKKILADVCAIPLAEIRLVWARKGTLEWGYDFKGSMSLGPMVTEATHFTK